MSIFPGVFEMPGDLTGRLGRRERRVALEAAVQNMFGPIWNIAEISDAALYGLRDRGRREARELH